MFCSSYCTALIGTASFGVYIRQNHLKILEKGQRCTRLVEQRDNPVIEFSEINEPIELIETLIFVLRITEVIAVY